MNKRREDASIPHEQRDDERALVERARGGDALAFRMLYERYHRRAYSLAHGMLRNQEDALDVVQEAFIKAHRHLEGFAGSSSFYTWLYRIVMNLAIDHLRRRQRARHVDFDEAVAPPDDGAAAGDDSLMPRILGANPGKALVRKEVREQIGRALEQLSDNHRAVILMREVEGLSYEEMAQVMQCSKGTIMSRLFHARRYMQKYLLEYMGGDKDFEA